MPNENDLAIRYNYTQFSQDKNVNVIPEEDFKRLISDTFSTMTSILRSTYGPYGSVIVISDQNETTTTKDGYNVCEAMGFSHAYKRMVYLAIKKICDRVNRNVGDGTTSCILLAEKIFNQLNDVIVTPEDKRNVLDILSKIESDIQNPESIKMDLRSSNSYIRPLDGTSLKYVIKLASNNDEFLTKALMDAFNPVYDIDDHIVSVNNVIPDSTVDRSIGSEAIYKVSYMPGNYRIRINMNPEIALSMQEKTNIKLCIYDHIFGETDWDSFNADYDKETPTIILATGFNPTFMNNGYVRYCTNRSLVKAPITIIPCTIHGDFVQDEIADLCAILDTKSRKLSDISHVDHKSLPMVNINIYKGNCMCFYDVSSPTAYIDTLKYEMENDDSKSIARRQNYENRIKALEMNNSDAMINVSASSSLELKMIMDKIDDCTSIVMSALKYGVVPNMLKYAYIRIEEEFHRIDSNVSEAYSHLHNSICNAISESIIGLFEDIWYSKYTIDVDKNYNERNEVIDNFYTVENDQSYNIITNEYVDLTQLPTSAQYDMEVVAAAVSIVKYLTTSRALIFDAFLQKPADDISSIESL